MADGFLNYLSNSGQGLLNMYRQAPGMLGDFVANTALPTAMSFSPGAAIQDSMQSGRDAGAAAQGGDYLGALKNIGLGMFAGVGAIPGVGTAERAAAQGIRAFHGSPHSFDRFDLSKIGTGEGAQAYGHGLYFAENEGTAKAYRDALTPGTGDSPKDVAARFLKNLDGDPERARAALRDNMERAMQAGDMDGVDRLRAAHGELFNPEPLKGSMYEVNINADPHAMLDWDKPLSEQSPLVQEALAKAGVSGGTGADAYRALGERLAPDLTMGGRFPGMKGHADLQAASEALHSAGIPGIKYLDQGSRGAGEGSRNYVVFNDELVNVLRKYGLAGMLGGGAAGYALSPSDAQAQEPR